MIALFIFDIWDVLAVALLLAMGALALIVRFMK
jgi:hypothetical protein